MTDLALRKGQAFTSRDIPTRYPAALPPPASQDLARDNGSVFSQNLSKAPISRVLLEGYQGHTMNTFQGEKLHMNPLGTGRPQSSTLLNIDDPVQVHLLVETALGDSKDFELLSPEEVDDLKKRIQSLAQRIEQTRQNLAIQSKYRDAAKSMSKLYGSARGKSSSDASDAHSRSRSSLLSKRASEQAKETDLELEASERKCELLAQELWNLEKKWMDLQKQLLEHTAGVLQMTHKGPKKKPPLSISKGLPAVPASPDSVYAYHNARNSIETPFDADAFDDRSLYRSADSLDDLDFVDRRDSIDSTGLSPPASKSRHADGNAEQLKFLSLSEKKLEELNNYLREIIINISPQKDPQEVPSNGTTKRNGNALLSQLEYLEMGLRAVDAERPYLINKQASEATAQSAAEFAMVQKVEELNRELRNVLLPYDPSKPMPPQVSEANLEQQTQYFRDSIDEIEEQFSRSSSKAAKDRNLEQTETVLMGLWDIIQAGDEESRNQRRTRKQARLGAGGEVDGASDVSENEDPFDEDASFSLQAFSSKIQRMAGQITALKEHKEVLQRQVKQQRELNGRSEAAKDTELLGLKDQVISLQTILQRAEADAIQLRAQLEAVQGELENFAANDKSAELAPLQAELAAKSAELASQSNEIITLRQEIAGKSEDLNLMQDLLDAKALDHEHIVAELSNRDARIARLEQEMQALQDKQAEAAQIKDLMDKKEQELEEMSMKVAELQTEVTIARAELEGAYGSRSQRAAAVAANPVIQKEIDNLNRNNKALQAEVDALKASNYNSSAEFQARVNTLQKELSETIEEYESMTKASIEWEKEREELERNIDALKDQREALETQLSDEKVRWMGMKSPGLTPDGTMSSSKETSTTVLKNEFKKMMRDTRAENMKALRTEQEQRRRLEDELRTLKKSSGSGLSNITSS